MCEVGEGRRVCVYMVGERCVWVWWEGVCAWECM